MIEIDSILISDDLFERKFVCDLKACKGACCVEGESGAPLEEEELGILDDIYEDIKPYLRKEGVKAIEKQGKYIKDSDGDWTTPLVKGKECAYVIFDENGITKCGIEKAYEEGKVEFKKPISCHLYPIRVLKNKKIHALNYHQWKLCKPACACGEKLDVKVFRFLKEPIIRAYGKDFFKKLELAEREVSSH